MAIAAGNGFTLALRSDGTVVCWLAPYIAFGAVYPNNTNVYYGQCSIPPGLSGVISIAAGWLHGLALTSNGTVVVWGSYVIVSGYGAGIMLGPAFVPDITQKVVALAGGCSHSLALTSLGQVLVWGSDNSYNQMTLPLSLVSGPRVMSISALGNNNIALFASGTFVVWGNSASGQLNVPLAYLAGVSAVAAGWGQYVVAFIETGAVAAWGRNNDGDSTPPVGLTGVTAVSASWGYSYVLLNSGAVVVWGNSYGGQRSTPSNLSGVMAIAAGEGHLVAMSGCTSGVLAVSPPIALAPSNLPPPPSLITPPPSSLSPPPPSPLPPSPPPSPKPPQPTSPNPPLPSPTPSNLPSLR